MREIRSIYIFEGTDARMRRLSSALSEKFKIKRSFPPRNADAVIFPLPTTRDGETVSGTFPAMRLSDAVSRIHSCSDGALFITGMAPEGFRAECEGLSHPCRDIYDSEKFAEENAAITAEGALFSYMKEGRGTVRGKRVLITGFGRVARNTAGLFASLGAEVTVAARSESALSEAAANGYGTARLFAFGEKLVGEKLVGEKLSAISKADLIINTVPARIISGYELAAIEDGAVIIELASAPYGIDPAEAEKYGHTVIRLPSLPASYAPREAADIIKNEVLRIFGELGGTT
ncbi:MAG: hypothetical protein LUG88_00310 [Clostridia bacterium]|nr:hypothetical protein [Clostridia bacterium]